MRKKTIAKTDRFVITEEGYTITVEDKQDQSFAVPTKPLISKSAQCPGCLSLRTRGTGRYVSNGEFSCADELVCDNCGNKW